MGLYTGGRIYGEGGYGVMGLQTGGATCFRICVKVSSLMGYRAYVKVGLYLGGLIRRRGGWEAYGTTVPPKSLSIFPFIFRKFSFMNYLFVFKEKMEVWLTSLKYALEKAIKKDPAKFSLNSSKNSSSFQLPSVFDLSCVVIQFMQE